MTNHIRTTLIFGLLSAICVIPLTHFPTILWGWPVALKCFILANLILYSFLLCRWSNTSIVSIAFPLLLATGMALHPGTYSGFMLVILGVFGWIRSAICFNEMPVRSLIAEFITLGGGAIFLVFWWPEPTMVLSVAIWLFFLFQTLYFFIVPPSTENPISVVSDPFEQASREMERLFKTNNIV